ncbi:unnamed protein product, partial [Pelagomonas calceolata]
GSLQVICVGRVGRASFGRGEGGGGVFSASLRGPGALEVVAQLAREHGVVREHRVDGRAVRAERLGERRLDVGRHAEAERAEAVPEREERRQDLLEQVLLGRATQQAAPGLVQRGGRRVVGVVVGPVLRARPLAQAQVRAQDPERVGQAAVHLRQRRVRRVGRGAQDVLGEPRGRLAAPLRRQRGERRRVDGAAALGVAVARGERGVAAVQRHHQPDDVARDAPLVVVDDLLQRVRRRRRDGAVGVGGAAREPVAQLRPELEVVAAHEPRERDDGGPPDGRGRVEQRAGERPRLRVDERRPHGGQVRQGRERRRADGRVSVALERGREARHGRGPRDGL